MTKTIVILGALDTKGDQIEFVAQEIKAKGYQVIIIDIGTGAKPSFSGDVSCEDVAKAAGTTIEEIRASKDRSQISKSVISGAVKKIKELYSLGKLDGIMSIGGYSAATVGTAMMKSLPFGVPKLMVSSAAGMPDAGTWFGTSDILMMNTPIDLVGLNEMVKDVLYRAAGAICGVLASPRSDISTLLSSKKPLVALTEWGPSENCCKLVYKTLEERGYQPIVFHAQGVGDQAMEELIAQGFFEGVIDIVLGAVTDELFEGRRAAGPQRLEVAGRRGLPQVIAPSGLNITGAGPTRKNREKYISRPKVLKLDDLRMMTRLNGEELMLVARTMAAKLNKAKGPVQFFIPLRGWSNWDRENSILYEPESDKIFIKELKNRLDPSIRVIELDMNLEDDAFPKAMVEAFDEMMKIHKRL